MPKSPVTSGIHCARHCTKYSNAVDFLFSEDYLLKETPGMRASQAMRSYPLPEISREEKRNFCIYLTLPSHSSPMWLKSLCSCKFPWGRGGRSFWIRLRRDNPITPTATVLCSNCRAKSSREPVEMEKKKKKVFSIISISFSQFWSPQTADTLQSHRAAIS